MKTKTAPVHMAPSVFVYTSKCCSAPARKPALVKAEGADSGLGHWVCSNCKRGCSVNRNKRKDD